MRITYEMTCSHVDNGPYINIIAIGFNFLCESASFHFQLVTVSWNFSTFVQVMYKSLISPTGI